VKLLLDTQLLLWVAGEPRRLSKKARALVEDPAHQLYFSPASLWEIVIKNSLGRADFVVDPDVLRRALEDNGYRELPILATHVLRAGTLEMRHKDPFDRLLIAQALSEGITLITADKLLARYEAPVRLV
jgi:PIN domain nuclease of toxin-antitoxin system